MTNWEKTVLKEDIFLREMAIEHCTFSRGHLVQCSDIECEKGKCALMEECRKGEKKEFLLTWFSEESSDEVVRLSKLEYDILEYASKGKNFKDIPFLAMMRVEGHFQDLDINENIGTILDKAVIVKK